MCLKREFLWRFFASFVEVFDSRKGKDCQDSSSGYPYSTTHHLSFLLRLLFVHYILMVRG